jgi:hypothetical protein
VAWLPGARAGWRLRELAGLSGNLGPGVGLLEEFRKNLDPEWACQAWRRNLAKEFGPGVGLSSLLTVKGIFDLERI